MRKSIVLSFFALLFCTTAFGQVDSLAENGLYRTVKYGFADADGNVVIPCQYDDVQPFSEGLAAVDAGDRFHYAWGFINEEGQMVIEPRYTGAMSFSNGLAAVNVSEFWWSGMWGFIDKSGQMVIEPRYQQVLSFIGELAPVCLDDKWGYIDRSGNMVIEPQFDEADNFEDGLANVRIGEYDEARWGCIDVTGKMVIEPLYENKVSFNGRALALTVINGKNVIIDRQGKIVLVIQDDYYCYFTEEFEGCGYIIKVGEQYGIVNEKGWLLEPQFDFILVNGEIALVVQDEAIGAIKKNGKWLFEPDESVMAYNIDDDLYQITINEKEGLLDENGWLVEPKYDRIGDFAEGLASVLLNDKVGFIDTTGKVVIKPKFELASIFMPSYEDGLAAVGKNGKVGLINKKGEWVIQAIFDDIETPFYDGMARAVVDEKYGIINEQGVWVIEPRYDAVGLFSEGLLPVLLDGKCGYVDTTGNVVIPLQYDAASGFTMGLAPVLVGDKWGFIDNAGKMVIEPQYYFVGAFDPETGLALVKIGDEETGTWGTIDKNGNFTPAESDEDE